MLEPATTAMAQPAGTEMQPGGDGTDWNKAKKKVIKLFNNRFANSSDVRKALCPVEWDRLDPDVLARTQVYGELATYLTHEYIIPQGCKNAGSFLSGPSVLDYLNALIQQAYDKFNRDADEPSRRFFACRDSRSTGESAVWLGGIRTKIKRITQERCKEVGGNPDQSVTPVCHEDCKNINKAYARIGTAEVRRTSHAPCLLARAAPKIQIQRVVRQADSRVRMADSGVRTLP